MDSIKRDFKILTGETDNDMVSLFVSNAAKRVLMRANRSELIEPLYDHVLTLALTRYERRGNEGLASYSEGGENESYLKEDEILSAVDNYRLTPIARRRRDEEKKSEEVHS